jgi:putative ABC transport system permease protein
VVSFPQPLDPPDGDPVQVQAAGVTTDFFRTFGVSPSLGRDFVADDGTPGEPDALPGDPGFVNNVALLDHRTWQTRFGGDPGAVGRVVTLGGAPTEIVGVLPEGFRIHLPADANVPPNVDVWVAFRLDFMAAPRGNVFLQIVGRLASDASLEQARAEADRFAADLRSREAGWDAAGYGLDVEPLHDVLVAPVRPILLTLQLAVGLVLLIACANVANLLLVRGGRRARDVAVRAAMGAGRSRIVRQLMSESVLLALLGAAGGVVVALLGVQALLALRPEALPRGDDVALDPLVLGFTWLVALVSSLLFGTWPALRSSRARLTDAMKERGRIGDSRSQRGLRNGVIVAEVALSTVLLVGAGLVVRSFLELQRVELGYRAEGILTFSLPVPGARFPEPEDRTRLLDALHERFAAIPGVESAAAIFPLPLSGIDFNGRWGLEEAEGDRTAFRQAKYVSVHPDYFEATRTRFVEGRAFTRAEYQDSAEVVVIDETLARRAFPGEAAVGRRILVRAIGPDQVWMDVVGVVEAQRHTSLEDGRETVFFTDRYLGGLATTWVVRADTRDPTSLVPAVRAVIREVEPSLPLADVRPFEGYVDDALAPTRFSLLLLTAFGAMALVLAAVGLYGVLAYVVGQRRAEIGVRMAFGADRGGILAMVLRQGLALAGIGLVAGLAAAWGLGGVMERMLVGTDASDPVAFAAVAAVSAVIATVACALPAIRASHVDPSAALREE